MIFFSTVSPNDMEITENFIDISQSKNQECSKQLPVTENEFYCSGQILIDHLSSINVL